MKIKKKTRDIEEVKDELVEKYRKQLDILFERSTFDLTFDEREKLIDNMMSSSGCKVLEKHIEKDPAGISANDYTPAQTSLCHCGTCATLCRDEEGNAKITTREIKTKQGIVTIREYGYYCSRCRKVFFPSARKVKAVRRKIQS